MTPPSRLGAGLLPALLLLTAASLLMSCGGEAEEPRSAALREELGIGSRPGIHWVFLEGEGNREAVNPTRVEIEPGDIVVFETADWRVHTLQFDLEALPGPARDFLVERSQMRAPPLVSMGSRFVVTFQGAPEGEYPFRSEGGGGVVQGTVAVRVPTG